MPYICYSGRKLSNEEISEISIVFDCEVIYNNNHNPAGSGLHKYEILKNWEEIDNLILKKYGLNPGTAHQADDREDL